MISSPDRQEDLLFEEREADDCWFLPVWFLENDRSGGVAITPGNVDRDAATLREADRLLFEYPCAQAGELGHVTVAYLVDRARVGHDTGIRSVDSIHVGQNLAEVGLESGRQRDGRRVRSSAAECCDIFRRAYTLESADNDDVSPLKFTHNPERSHLQNTCVSVARIGDCR